MVRKLRSEENIKTRPLYTQVFNEDTEEFVEYYYREIGVTNAIYTIEEKAMLHLNPYKMSIYGNEVHANYIVAVATKEEYRKQGLMKRLMITAMKDMYDQGQPFTYLMPAAEAIYEPYDFVVVGTQKYYKENIVGSNDLLTISNGTDEQISVRNADDEDCEAMAIFSNGIMKNKHDVFTLRSLEYYRRLLKEQKAQNGGVKIYSKDNEMVAIAPFADEAGLKYRDLLQKENITIPLEPFDQHNMMARIMNVKAFLSCIPVEIIRSKGLQCFNLIDQINTSQTGYYELQSDNTLMFLNETREVPTYTIGELTRLIFENTSVVLNEIV